MEWFNCTDPEQIVIIASVISLGIAKNLTNAEINGLGNFFQLIGQNLEVIATQRVLNQEFCNSPQDTTNSNSTMPGSESNNN